MQWCDAMQAKGELHLEVTYKPFEDDDTDSGYREAEAYALLLQQQAITDVKVSLMLPPHLCAGSTHINWPNPCRCWG